MLIREDAEELVRMMKGLSRKIKEINNDTITRHFLYMSAMAVRHYTNGVTVTYCSQQAKELLDTHNKSVKNHSALNRVNKSIKKPGALTIDHLFPVNDQIKKFFKDQIDINELFNNAGKQALILKDESAKLNKKYKDSRPNGWKFAYLENDIELVSYKYERKTNKKSNRSVKRGLIMKEVIVQYKNEKYSVKNDGSVLRHPKNPNKPRPSDDSWTFGNVDKRTGYMTISSERIHRIVCFAFHGNPPDKEYVVDHIDTNRQNNRPENLRWITKLENALNNPITRKKIILLCGSIEKFLEDPSILRDNSQDINISWMRSVTPSEALISKEKLLKWAESDRVPNGGKIGEWIFKGSQSNDKFTESLTLGAIQEEWRTPSSFLKCPSIHTDNPIKIYYDNLKKGDLFMQNKYGTFSICEFAITDDQTTLLVITQANQESIKGYAIALIYYKDGLFVHQSKGTFFTVEGAMKEFTLLQGMELTGEDSIDDYA